MKQNQERRSILAESRDALAATGYDSLVRHSGRPGWIRRSLATNPIFFRLKRMVRELELATVCESAGCPNINECWCRGTVTVMILGDICTRNCRFCGVSQGLPSPPDAEEPSRVAELISRLGVGYVVITSVDRDDLSDGGASHWAETIRRLRTDVPDTKVEALIPDFRGEPQVQETVMMSRPDVLVHNVETVEALHRKIRPQGGYRRSLELLERSATQGLVTKSGFMVGLGETKAGVNRTLHDLADIGVSMVTVGQYLQPNERSMPVARYWMPDEFDEIEREGKALGLALFAGPLVRSSYLADELARRCGFGSLQQAGSP